MERITPGQIKRIWATAWKRGLEEEETRAIMERLTGKTSMRTLTWREAKTVIMWLETEGDPRRVPVKTRAPLSGSNVIAPATPRQIGRITDDCVRAGWDQEHLEAFITRLFGRDSLRKSRRKEAGVVIHVLGKEIKKRMEAA